MLWQIPAEIRRNFLVRESGRFGYIFKCDQCAATFTISHAKGKVPLEKCKEALDHLATHRPTASQHPPASIPQPPPANGTYAHAYKVVVGKGYTNVSRIEATDKTVYGSVVPNPKLSEHSTNVRAANRRHAAFVGEHIVADYIARHK